MNEHLVELHNRAFSLKNSGHVEEATALFQRILREQPDWEHGYGRFYLAQCEEELGRLDKAQEDYEAAVGMNPNDVIFLGAYASFLYLHGDPVKAFETYSRLLAIDLAHNDTQGSDSTTIALNELGVRLGLSPEEIHNRIELIAGCNTGAIGSRLKS